MDRRQPAADLLRDRNGRAPQAGGAAGRRMLEAPKTCRRLPRTFIRSRRHRTAGSWSSRRGLRRSLACGSCRWARIGASGRSSVQAGKASEPPEISPDGRWIAHHEGTPLNSSIVVRPFPNVDGGRVVVAQGGSRRCGPGTGASCFSCLLISRILWRYRSQRARRSHSAMHGSRGRSPVPDGAAGRHRRCRTNLRCQPGRPALPGVYLRPTTRTKRSSSSNTG